MGTQAFTFIAIASILASGVAYAQSLEQQAQCAALARKTFQEDSYTSDQENQKNVSWTAPADYFI